MKLEQLSIFLENKPGQLLGPCKLLGEQGINIVTMSLADTQQFGILRLIVKDAARAKQVIEQAGGVANLTEVVAVRVPYRPGGLAHALEAIEGMDINVEYMYTLPVHVGQDGVLVFRFDDPDGAVAALEKTDLKIVRDDELDRFVFNG